MARRRVSFGLGLWPFPYFGGRGGGRMRFDTLLSLAEQADHAGYDCVWSSDSIARAIPRFDTFLYLTALAMRTKRIKLGTCVVVTPLRHPVMLTRIMSTLDVFSDGRFVLGAGAGWLAPEFETLDVPFRDRGGRTNEALKLVRRLWTEDRVDFDGKHYHVKGITIDPKPIQKPHPPILIGGHSEAAFRRIAELGDGWVTLSYAGAGAIADGIHRIKELSAERGRHWDPYVVAELNINIAPAEEDALRDARAWHASFVPPGATKVQMFEGLSAEELAKKAAIGPPETCVQRVQELIDAGASSIMFRFMAYDWQMQFDRLTDEVLPRFVP